MILDFAQTSKKRKKTWQNAADSAAEHVVEYCEAGVSALKFQSLPQNCSLDNLNSEIEGNLLQSA